MSLRHSLICLMPVVAGCWSLKPGHEVPDGGPRDVTADLRALDVTIDAGSDATDVVSDVVRLDAPDVVSDVVRLDAPDVVSDVVRLDAPDVVSDVVRADVPVVVPTGLRLLWPPGLSTVTNERPPLRWSEEVSGLDVVMCQARGCGTGVGYRAEVVGRTHTPPPGVLAPGVWFWSLRRRDNGQAVSATWQFRVPAGRHVRADGAFGVSHRDMNNDGHWDIAVGAPGPRGSMNVGAVHVHLGGPTLSNTPSFRPTSNVIGFGWDLVWGDFNGDLRADLAVAAFESGLEGQGRIGSVQLLQSTGSGFLSPQAIQCGRCVTGDFFATRVTAGDVNGDGLDDLFIGSPGPAQYVHVHYGRNTGLLGQPDALLANPLQRRTAFGTAITVVGDLDGDGFGDLVVSDICDPGLTTEDPAVCAPGPSGRLHIFFGSVGGVMSGAHQVVNGWPGAALGRELVAVGDLNADGYADLLASGTDGGNPRDYGALYVFLGRPRAMLTPSIMPWARMVTPTGARDFAVSAAGIDLDGDGTTELVAGAPSVAMPSVSNRGQAYPYRLSPFGNVSALPTGPVPTGTSANFGLKVSSVGDVNGDGLGDLVITAPNHVLELTPTGNAYLWFGGSSSFPSAAPSRVFTGVSDSWLGRSLAP